MIVFIVIILIILMIIQLTANKRKIDAAKRPAHVSMPPIPVKVARAELQNMEVSLIKTGNLTPFSEAKILSAISGTIKDLSFKLGDHVSIGQALAILDTRKQRIELQKSEYNVTKLKSDLNIYAELLTEKAATQEKVNEINQHYQDALNQSSQLRRQIAEGEIRSPINGIVSAKATEKGVFIDAGSEVATIVSLSKEKVQLSLTEQEVYQVKVSQPVKITTDVFPGIIAKGKVSFISPQADEAHSYAVEIIIESEQEKMLLAGTFVNVEFLKPKVQKRLVIPRGAIIGSIQEPSVFVLNNGIAHIRAIKTGIENGENVEVKSGLTLNSQVVISGHINLKEGSKVNLVN